LGAKELITNIVMRFFSIGGMGVAIDFDDQPRLATGKIGDVRPTWMLFAEVKTTGGVTPQACPKYDFRLRHAFA